MLPELEKLLTQYGDLKLSEVITKLKGPNIHPCPKCGTHGFSMVKYNAYPSGLPDSGWVDDWQEKKVTCSLCDGLGYTEKEMKPIIKTTILGYETA